MINEVALLKDWLEKNGMKKDCRSVAREQLLEFLGVSINTLNRWLRGVCPPYGQNLVRIRFFLHKAGVSGIDLPTDFEIEKLMEAVSLRFISVKSVMKKIGLPDESSAIGYMIKRARPTKKRRAEISELLKKFDLEKELRKYKIFQNLRVVKTFGLSERNVQISINQAEILRALADEVRAVRTLAELVLSDAFDSTHRQELRQLCGTTLPETQKCLTRLLNEAERNKALQT